MLRSLKEIIGYELLTFDEPTGKADDFLVDENGWTVRYLVAEMGSWLEKRKVLVSTQVFGRPRWETARLPVNLTKEDLQSSPEFDFDAPFSREQQQKLHAQHGWENYWASDFNRPAPVILEAGPQKPERTSQQEMFIEKNPTLRSVQKLLGYRIEATDGVFGRVEDLIFDDETWVVRYMVVETGNVLSPHKVLIAPLWLDGIDSEEKTVQVGLPQETIRESPEFDPTAPVNRQYEEVIYDYYGRPKYWL